MKLHDTVYCFEDEDENVVNYTFSLEKAKEWQEDSDGGTITELAMRDLIKQEREVEVYESPEASIIGKIELVELLAELYNV